jgi:hypothetical protein
MQLETETNNLSDFIFQQTSFYSGTIIAPPRDPSQPPPKSKLSNPYLIADEKSNPLIVTVEHTLNAARASADSSTTQEQIQLLEETKRSAHLISKIYSAQHNEKATSFVSGFMKRIASLLEQTGIGAFFEGPPPQNGICDSEAPKDLARLLISLQFIFCQPSTVNDFAVFGEGWFWGSCMLLHLMGQRHKFELLDFTAHILRVDKLNPFSRTPIERKHKKDPPSEEEKRQPFILNFLFNGSIAKALNDTIFDTLESYVAHPPAKILQLNPAHEL